MAAPEQALDDLLGAPAAPGASSDDDMLDDDSDVEKDDFSMFAEEFLDDSLPMADRVEALRSAIMAAGGNPLE